MRFASGVIAVAALVAAVYAADPFTHAYADLDLQLSNIFASWKAKHNKHYSSPTEHETRFAIFKKNLDEISTHNRLRAAKVGWTKGVNQFTDLTASEFKARYLSTTYKRLSSSNIKTLQFSPSELAHAVSASTSIDWRTKGAVTPVKDQGQCGSCWSFSTTGSIEGYWQISGNTLVGLSEQNLIDCSTAEGNQGCNGGDMPSAMQYVISNGGIDTEASYPYTATGPNSCQYDESNKGASIPAFQRVPQADDKALAAALLKGPVSIAVDASDWQSYAGGIYSSSSCSSTNLDHGVLAVGFDGTAWIVKNSWSDQWGEEGYIRLTRATPNMCGVSSDASMPTSA